MSRTYTLTTKSCPPTFNPVTGNRAVPNNIPLRGQFKFLGGNVSRGSSMGQLCDNLRTYGCNVNPMRVGATSGQRRYI